MRILLSDKQHMQHNLVGKRRDEMFLVVILTRFAWGILAHYFL